MPQPHKGDRDAFTVRLPRDLGRIVRARAKERRMSTSDYVGAVLAESIGQPELAPMAPLPEDTELSMSA